MQSVKFLVFADFHFCPMFPVTHEHYLKLQNRAEQENVDFIAHCGDFGNGYKLYPSLIDDMYMNGPFTVYGIYGNHELEGEGNTMAYVTPRLTNDKNVIFGTPDGKIGDGSIGYYYFDKGDFRFICTDTNYSLNPETQKQEHNTGNSYGPPRGNVSGHDLGDVQFEWVKKLLYDAADKNKKCIILSHSGMYNHWDACPSATKMRAIFAEVNNQKKGTVMLCINGHNHRNRFFEEDGVYFLDVNATVNGEWRPERVPHYDDSHTFDASSWRKEPWGKDCSDQQPINSLWMAPNSWFFEDPVSAVVTLSLDEQKCDIDINGTETKWLFGIEPNRVDGRDGVEPRITSRKLSVALK